MSILYCHGSVESMLNCAYCFIIYLLLNGIYWTKNSWNNNDLILKLRVFKVILHQFWVKKFSPENWIWNTAVHLLSYSCMFQVEICSHQLEICKSVCVFIVLVIALWRLINFRLFCSDDCRSWPREEKINNHGCLDKHAHIPDNDYWGICLFHVVWTNFLQLILCGRHGIYIYFVHQLNIAHER